MRVDLFGNSNNKSEMKPVTLSPTAISKIRLPSSVDMRLSRVKVRTLQQMEALY